jgi:replication factor C large subunit
VKKKMDDRKIGQLARMANGDVRSMLIDLETAMSGVDPKHIGYRNFEENVFNTIRLIFKTTSIENARIAVENCEKDSEELFLWLEQNIQEEYDTAAIAKAYDYLSKADIFGTRIMKRQAWSLSKYASDLMVYGTALAKTKPSPRFVAYRPPFFRRTSRSALRKIAVGLHTSTANAPSYLPLIKMHPKVCEKLGLDEKETDSLLG